MKIIVIIPAYNEEANIIKTIEKLKKDYPKADYLVVNDCSKDETKKLLDDYGANYISLPVNLGIGGAVQSGYRYAYHNDYDIAIQIDGDGQHDTKYLKDVIEPLLRDEADICIGSRFINKEGFQSSSARRMGIRLLDYTILLFSHVKVTDCTSGYRAVNKRFIKKFANNYPIDYPEPEAICYAKLHGGRIKEVPVIMKERTGGKSSIRPIHSLYYMLKVTLSIIICCIGFRKGE